jgi:hypothetical protein
LAKVTIIRAAMRMMAGMGKKDEPKSSKARGAKKIRSH